MNKVTTTFAALGLGASLAYFFDPRQGERRRAMVRDKITRTKNNADEAIEEALRDMRNRTRGILAEATAQFSEEGAPDWIIHERVRAEIGRWIRHASSISVEVNGGNVTLRGPILREHADVLLPRVSRVRGVRSVNDQLEYHDSPEDIPALQGDSSRPTPTDNWSPSLRLISAVSGGVLALYGAARRGLTGTALLVAGVGLAARGVANRELQTLVGMGSRRDAIRINKAININAPLDQIYQFWSNLQNLPRFMDHLKEVKYTGAGRSHWVAKGPAGVEMEWDAITTQEIPNQLIAWESLEGSKVKTSGKVDFRSNPDGSTRVQVHWNYTPPAGAIGHAVATLMGSNPKQAMDEDLVRLKSLFEEGETTSDGRKIYRRSVTESASAS